MPKTKLVKLTLEERDGWWTLETDDMEGFWLAGPNAVALIRDIEFAMKLLYQAQHRVPVTVKRIRPLTYFIQELAS